MVTLIFNNYDDLFDKICQESSEVLAGKIVSQAKALAHVGVYHEGNGKVGGRMRNSIMYKTPEKTGGFNDSSGATAPRQINVNPKRFEAYAGTAVFYAQYEEFGTRYRAPHPFLRPSILIYTGQKGAREVMAMIAKEMAQGKLVRGETRVFN